MTLSLSTLMPLVLQAVRNPREAAHTVLSLGVPRAALVPALALVVILSIILTMVGTTLTPQTSGPEQAIAFSPIAVAALLGAFLAIYIAGIHWTGRALGGTGTLPETALLMVFLQFVLLVGQVIELLLWLVAPPLAGLFVIAVAVLAFWININFVDVLHGYGSLGKSFLLVLLVSVGIALGAVFLMTRAGISLQG